MYFVSYFFVNSFQFLFQYKAVFFINLMRTTKNDWCKSLFLISFLNYQVSW